MSNDFAAGSARPGTFQHGEINGVSHDLVSEQIGMQIIRSGVCGIEDRGVRRIAHRSIEIDDPVG
jgi:hypothetical protein